jgi:hypothetical protein
MFAATRGAMIARLLLIGAVTLVTLGAQSSCSNNDGEGILTVGDPGPGKGTSTGPTFSVTLALKDSSGAVTSRFARGELITFELTVLNRTNATIRIQLPTMGGNQDFQVFRPGVAEAEWDWLANKTFAAVVTEVTLDAGGTQVFTGTWDQVKLDGAMLPAGSYAAAGRLFAVQGQVPALTDDDTRSPRVGFIVN